MQFIRIHENDEDKNLASRYVPERSFRNEFGGFREALLYQNSVNYRMSFQKSVIHE